MERLLRLSRASIGKKLLMALSGLVLLVFLAGHLAGNLKVVQGAESLNAYAAWLKGHPLLWVFRFGMLAALAVHIALGVSLARDNRAARPHRYAHPDTIQMSFSERHILLSGLLVAAFVVYHLLHLTVGAIDPAGAASLLSATGEPDVYARVVLGFRNPWVSASYLVGLCALALHLQHALRSALQTLGLSHETHQAVIEGVARLVPGLIALGFAAIPLLVLAGMVPAP